MREYRPARRTRFERRYALPEQILPRHILDRDVPQAEALRELVSFSARAHGIGSLRDFSNYFRLKQLMVKPFIDDLADVFVTTGVAVFILGTILAPRSRNGD